VPRVAHGHGREHGGEAEAVTVDLVIELGEGGAMGVVDDRARLVTQLVPGHQDLSRRLEFQRHHHAGDRSQVRLAGEAFAQRPQPAAIGHDVVVGEGDDLAGRGGDPAIAGRRDAGVRLAHHTRARDIGRRRVPPPVVDDDHLVAGMVESGQLLHAAPQLARTREVAGHDDAHPGERYRVRPGGHRPGVCPGKGPAQLAAQRALEFGGRDHRAGQGQLDASQRVPGPAREDPCARVGRRRGPRAVEVAERVGEVDDGDPHRAWQPQGACGGSHDPHASPFQQRCQTPHPRAACANAE